MAAAGDLLKTVYTTISCKYSHQTMTMYCLIIHYKKKKNLMDDSRMSTHFLAQLLKPLIGLCNIHYANTVTYQ